MAAIKNKKFRSTACSGWLMCVVVLQLRVKNNHTCLPNEL